VNNPLAGNLIYNRWHEIEMLPLQFKIHFLSFHFIFELSICLAISNYENVFVTWEGNVPLTSLIEL
jgi:hypothetical protein